jgi:hypothetical protein
MSRWGVLSTIKAPRSLTDVFVRHYLNLGCNVIYIFFDDPAVTELDEGLFNDPRVRVQVCTEEYWVSATTIYPAGWRKSRHSSLMHRQGVNLSTCLSIANEVEWLLHVDVDELLNSHVDISQLLSETPNNLYAIGAKPYEAIYKADRNKTDPFDACFFKSSVSDSTHIVSKIYESKILPSSRGFWGHSIGKSFIRVGEPIDQVSPHVPKPLNKSLCPVFYSRTVELLHFEALTFDLFLSKQTARISSPDNSIGIASIRRKRLALLDSIARSKGMDGLQELYEKMHYLDMAQVRLGLKSGWLIKRSWREQASLLPLTRYCLQAENGEIFAYSTKSFLCRPTKNSDETEYLTLYCDFEPGQSGLAYLYLIERSAIKRYIHVTANGGMRIYTRKEAYFLNFEMIGANRIRLRDKKRVLSLESRGTLKFSESCISSSFVLVDTQE